MEFYSKTIRVLEPYGGWITQTSNLKIYHESLDTGLGNRLFHWLNLYRISEYYNFDYKLLVEKIWWPELNYIELPNTDYLDFNYSFDEYSDYKNNFIKDCNPITNKMFDDFLKGNSILKKLNHWYSDFRYIPIAYPFPKIKLKNINDLYLKEKLKNSIGIHIRRINGIDYPKKNSIYKDKYGVVGMVSNDDLDLIDIKRKHTLNKTDTQYIPNEYYFKWIDMFLNHNVNSSVFISHDMPSEFLKPFYEKYGTKIITKREILNDKEIKKSHIKMNWPYSETLENVLDLFSLSFCSCIVGHPNSSWSTFAKKYSNIDFPEYIPKNII